MSTQYKMNESNKERMIGNLTDYTFQINGSKENIKEQIDKREEQKISEGMNKYMPIGSIVMLKNSDKLKMILGFNYELQGKTYDYVSCEYPFGINLNHGTILFNHDQIDRVYHIGYINEQERAFKKELDLESPNHRGLK